jgi:hypothetical protein
VRQAVRSVEIFQKHYLRHLQETGATVLATVAGKASVAGPPTTFAAALGETRTLIRKTTRNWPKAAATLNFHTPWPPSTPRRRGNGAGSTCSRRRTSPWTRGLARCDGTMWMSRCCRAPQGTGLP